MNIIFVGASTPNLFGARELKKLGYNVVVYERKGNYINEQRRAIPSSFIKEIGYDTNSNDEYIYLKITEIKDFLSKDLDIRYHSNLKIDLNLEKVYLNNEELLFDFLILNTAHEKLEQTKKKIFVYDYTLENINNHFPGNSLVTSVSKMKKIIDLIIKSKLR